MSRIPLNLLASLVWYLGCSAIWSVLPSHPREHKTVAIVFSADGERVGYIAKRGERWLVVVDGQDGPEYDDIWLAARFGVKQHDRSTWFVRHLGGIVFSPDSRRVAYGAKRGQEWTVVVDGEEGTAYDGIGEGSPVFSPDSQRVAYEVERGRQSVVVVDGQEGREYGKIGVPSFSEDSEHVLYLAWREGKGFTVVDGEETRGQKADDGVTLVVVVSPDRDHAAYWEKRRNGWVVVLDGKDGPKYDGEALRTGPVFIDGGGVQYLASRGGKIYRVTQH